MYGCLIITFAIVEVEKSMGFMASLTYFLVLPEIMIIDTYWKHFFIICKNSSIANCRLPIYQIEKTALEI